VIVLVSTLFEKSVGYFSTTLYYTQQQVWQRLIADTASWPSLAGCSWTDSFPSGCNCIPVSGMAPAYLAELCLPITASASRRGGLRSATTSNLVTHARCRLSTYGTRAFSVAGPVCWNSLPDYLKSSDLSFNCFRQQLKTFLFYKYWHQSQHYFSALETLLMRSANAWYLLTYLYSTHTSQKLRIPLTIFLCIDVPSATVESSFCIYDNLVVLEFMLLYC